MKGVGQPKDQTGGRFGDERREFLRCARKGRLADLNRLLKIGVDPDGANAAGQTPLMLASHEGRLPIVERLLSAGADVNAVDLRGLPAIVYAIDREQVEVVRLVLAAGAMSKVTRSWYDSPLLRAVGKHNLEIAELLFTRGVDMKQIQNDFAWRFANRCGHEDMIALFRAHGFTD